MKKKLLALLIWLIGAAASAATSLPYPAPATPYGELENGDSIVVKMAGAKTTTEPTFYVAYVDTQETNYAPGNQKGSFNDASEVTALSTPAAGYHRLAVSITVCNIDTVSQSVSVAVANGASRYYLLSAYALAPNATVIVSVGGGATSSTPLTLPVTVPNGGTGQTTLTTGAYLIGNGTGAVSLVGPGSDAQIAISNGTTQSMHSISGDVTMADTGAVTIGAGKVTDADLALSYIKADGTRAFTGAQSLGSHNLTNVTDPVNAQDAATKNYVDSVASGIQARQVKYATAAGLPAYSYFNGVGGVGATITETGFGAASIDGSTPSVGDRLLIKNETAANAPYNGIYTVTLVGSGIASFVFTRALDQDQPNEFIGVVAFVQAGTANTGSSWICTSVVATVGTTNVTWAQFSPSQPATGTSGGIPYYSSTTSLASSALLVANQLVTGGGAGTAPATLGSLGTTTTVLHGNAGGAPSFTAIVNADITNSTIDLTAKVTGTLPIANGGSNSSTALDGGRPIISNASKIVESSGYIQVANPGDYTIRAADNGALIDITGDDGLDNAIVTLPTIAAGPGTGVGKGFRVTIRNATTNGFGVTVTTNTVDGIDERTANITDVLNAKWSHATYVSTGTAGAGAGKGWVVENAVDWIGKTVTGVADIGNSTPANITSFTISPGEWDVAGVISYVSATLTTVTCSVSTTTAGLGTAGDNRMDIEIPSTAVNNQDCSVPCWRLIVTDNATTLYLVGDYLRTVAGTENGRLSARRVR